MLCDVQQPEDVSNELLERTFRSCFIDGSHLDVPRLANDDVDTTVHGFRFFGNRFELGETGCDVKFEEMRNAVGGHLEFIGVAACCHYFIAPRRGFFRRIRCRSHGRLANRIVKHRD